MTMIIIFFIPWPSMPEAVIREGEEMEEREQRVVERERGEEGFSEVIEVADD